MNTAMMNLGIRAKLFSRSKPVDTVRAVQGARVEMMFDAFQTMAINHDIIG